jgi:CobQ-like glutamine amidotransferase family enzyme
MIQLVQLYPNHLNLNGDGGNLLVLAKRAEWGGLKAQLSTIHPGVEPTQRPDVLLIGHGSTAAWRQIYADFARLAPVIRNWMQSGTQVIAISSGYAAMHGLFDELPNSINRIERVSKFDVVDFEGQQVYGYVNSDLDLDKIVRHGQILGSLLHGPLLAKNSWLADSIIESVRGRQSREKINSSKLDEVEKLVIAAQELAKEQAES